MPDGYSLRVRRLHSLRQILWPADAAPTETKAATKAPRERLPRGQNTNPEPIFVGVFPATWTDEQRRCRPRLHSHLTRPRMQTGYKPMVHFDLVCAVESWFTSEKPRSFPSPSPRCASEHSPGE